MGLYDLGSARQKTCFFRVLANKMWAEANQTNGDPMPLGEISCRDAFPKDKVNDAKVLVEKGIGLKRSNKTAAFKGGHSGLGAQSQVYNPRRSDEELLSTPMTSEFIRSFTTEELTWSMTIFVATAASSELARLHRRPLRLSSCMTRRPRMRSPTGSMVKARWGESTMMRKLYDPCFIDSLISKVQRNTAIYFCFIP